MNYKVFCDYSRITGGSCLTLLAWQKACMNSPRNQWDESQEKAFQTLKDLLGAARILTYSVPFEKFIFHSDPSEYSIGQYFLLRTDHSTLRWLLQFKSPGVQLEHWIVCIHTYVFSIEHRRDTKYGNTNVLSRRRCIWSVNTVWIRLTQINTNDGWAEAEKSDPIDLPAM